MNPKNNETVAGVTRPLRIALTGGIAVGKSSVEKMLREEGISVLDTDIVAHRCLQAGHPAREQIVQEFGEDVVLDGGSLDRGRLGERVFQDEDARNRLNQIVHPYVKDDVRQWLHQQERAGRHAVVSVPLLFEAEMADGWDCIVCVDADEDVVLQRLSGRGFNPDQAKARMAAQWPQQEKRRRSDRIIENNDSLENLKQNVLDVWREITQKEQDHE